MKLPPYQSLPPEVRMRLRQRVLPSLSTRPGPRVPYMVAAAIVVVAAATLALLISPARNAAPPAGRPTAAPTSSNPDLAAFQRLTGECHADSGTWQAGAYLLRHNGDGVLLATKPMDHTLGVCLISNGHPTPSSWFQMVVQRPDHDTGTYQATHDNGLVYGFVSYPAVSITVNGVLAVVEQGTFLAEADTPGQVTLVTRDAHGDILDQGTIS